MTFISFAMAAALASVSNVGAEPTDRDVAQTAMTERQSDNGEVAEDIKAAAALRFGAYVRALSARNYQAAYAMLRLSYQAANPRLEWEMKLRARDGLWADGAIRTLRVTWYQNPQGQPSGLYAAYDFRGDREDGGMDCGYIVVHQAIDGGDFFVVRTDTSFVPSSLITEGVPEVGVLRELPCFLGKGIATAL